MKKFLVALMALLSFNSFAADCTDLMAGQYTNVGTVCYDVVGTDLKVTYTTTGNWFINETHLWVGTNLALMPQTNSGNPKIGNFPYKASLLNTQSYTFTIPMYTLGLTTCPYAFIGAAHAVVSEKIGSTVIRTETGWGAGDRFNVRGSWAMYTNVYIECGGGGGGGGDTTCETAFALGDKTLISFLDTSRWGWQITFDGSYGTYPIYAAAGQNDITKGTLVGYLTVIRNLNGSVTANFDMISGFTMDETHLYVGSTYTTTAAPGQYGNTHDLTLASNDSFTVYANNGTIYVVAHAVVCGQY